METTVKYIIVADTETGGLPNKNKKAFDDVALAELALVVIDCVSLEIVTEYAAIIAPYKEGLEYSPQAEEVHGLSVAHLTKNGEDVKTVYKETKAILKKYANKRIGAILAGHNFQLFDIPFFEGMFAFNNDDLWEYVKFVEDTMKLGWYRGLEQENYKLGTCCRKEGVELVEAHRALSDTRANAQLLIKYLQQLRGESVESNSASMEIKSRFRESFQIV